MSALCNAMMMGGGVSSIIQSIQQVSITIANNATSNTTTINSVVTANCIVFFNGFTTPDTGGGTDLGFCAPIITLTNATTVTATTNRQDGTNNKIANATIVEFKSGVINSRQAGTIAIVAAATSNTATITSVDTSKSFVIYSGSYSSSNGTDQRQAGVTLTNATTVTANNLTASGTRTVGYQVIEFVAGYINNVQKLTVNVNSTIDTKDTTITAVVLANSFVAYGGAYSNRTASDNANWYGKLTSTTNYNITNGGNTANGSAFNHQATIVEFVPGILKSVQRGLADCNTTAIVNTTITAVNTAKAVVNNVHQTCISTENLATNYVRSSLTSATNLRSQLDTGTGSASNLSSYEVVEFK